MTDDSNPLKPDQTEPVWSAAPARSDSTTARGDRFAEQSPRDVEDLLERAEQALAEADEDRRQLPLSPFRLEDFTPASSAVPGASLELVRDVELDVKIELGRAQMYLEDVLKLRKGAVVPLDKLAGDPVDILANGRLIARGEVVVMNDNLCVRVLQLVAGDRAA